VTIERSREAHRRDVDSVRLVGNKPIIALADALHSG
jgi:hypothetical protein